MVDCTEWLEATLGTDAFGDDVEMDSSHQMTPHRKELGAVLCLIDCQLGMFQPTKTNSDKGGNSKGKMTLMMDDTTNTAGELSERVDTLWNHSTVFSSPLMEDGVVQLPLPPPSPKAEVVAVVSVDEGGCGGSNMPEGGDTTPFRTAIRSVLKLYQDKLIVSSRDVIALVLYNTREPRNAYKFPGVYVFHYFSPIGVHSVLELEELDAAGMVPSAAYNKFKETIGHTQSGECRLSDTLWAAQHMLLSLHLSGIVSRRIFLFTNDDGPHQDDVLEIKRCLARVCDLSRAGMILEVFSLHMGLNVATIKEDRLAKKEEEEGNSSTDTSGGNGGGDGEFLHTPSTAAPEGTVLVMEVCKERRFRHGEFWEGLRRAVSGALQVERQDCVDALCVNTDLRDFDDLLSAVRRRARVQRAYQNTLLSIGVSVDGRPVPTMAVSVYYPLVPAKLQTMRWISGCTNEAAMRQEHVEVKRSLFEDDNSTNAVVDPGGVQHFALVGGRRFFLSPRDKRRILQASTAGAGSVGFSILCFKSTEDVLQHKHVIRMPSFLHPNLREGGEKSLRLFVRLTRCLAQKNKVAVAQFVASHGGAPRLVVLVPSLPSSSVPSRSLPVKGLGLYVVPLPYAEDIRSVPSMPCFCSRTVPSQGDVALAKCIVSCLSVSYDINAVPNPALQLRCKILQDMAQQTEAVTMTGKAAPEASPKGAASGSQIIEDFSLPDREGMACYAELFHEFNKNVLVPSYNADILCMPPRSNAAARGKLPRKEESQEELGDGDQKDALIHQVEAAFAGNALHTLTLVQLKAYLKALGLSAGGVRRKDDMVQHVARVLEKRKQETL